MGAAASMMESLRVIGSRGDAETRRRGGLEVVDDSVKTFFESGGTKVDEQTDGQVQGA